MRFWFLNFLGLIMVFSAQGQGTKLSKPERYWAIWHPLAALKIKRTAKYCDTVYKLFVSKNNSLNDFINGGKQDAFRHIFYMAAFAQQVNSKKVKRLGLAHEKGNYEQFLKQKTEEGEVPDSVATAMDIFNNEIGIKIGGENKHANLNELATLTLKKIKDGEARIIKRSKNGTYLTCENLEVNLPEYKGNWRIPKCLVPSNYTLD